MSGGPVRVALFVTCLNDTLFPGTGQAVVKVLERLGCVVSFDARQTCCGQMHHNSGYAREAAALMRRFVDIYCDAETVVVPSTSCTATADIEFDRVVGVHGPRTLDVVVVTGR